MTCDYANMAIAAAGVAGAFFGAGATYWAAWRQTPKPDARIDGVALKYMSIGEGKNLFIATATNHGNAVAEIARTEVHATVDGFPVKGSIGAMDVVGTLAAGANKELWLEVSLPEPMSSDVHDGRKRLRVTVTLHPKNGKAIRSSFDFSREPRYGFVPSATP
jgi:hypothetical protein